MTTWDRLRKYVEEDPEDLEYGWRVFGVDDEGKVGPMFKKDPNIGTADSRVDGGFGYDPDKELMKKDIESRPGHNQGIWSGPSLKGLLKYYRGGKAGVNTWGGQPGYVLSRVKHINPQRMNTGNIMSERLDLDEMWHMSEPQMKEFFKLFDIDSHEQKLLKRAQVVWQKIAELQRELEDDPTYMSGLPDVDAFYDAADNDELEPEPTEMSDDAKKKLDEIDKLEKEADKILAEPFDVDISALDFSQFMHPVGSDVRVKSEA